MLFETAIFDAYAVGFEFRPAEFVAANNDLNGYRAHALGGLPAGRFSDDTLMSCWVANVILRHWGESRKALEIWHHTPTSSPPLDFVREFVTGYRRDPRAGFARRFKEFLDGVTSPEDFLQRIDNRSNRSGGAMRAGPCGLLPSPVLVREVAAIQAATTHNTQDGLSSAIAAALMVHYFTYRIGAKAKLGDFLNTWTDSPWYDWARPWTGSIEAVGWMPVSAAVTAIVQSSSLSECLQRCVAFTGDTDTAAAIAGSAASWSEEIQHDIPVALRTDFKDDAGELHSLDGTIADFVCKWSWTPGYTIEADLTLPTDTVCTVCFKRLHDHCHSMAVPRAFYLCDGRLAQLGKEPVDG